MKTPPGCPLREVTKVEVVPDGAFVSLSCSHVQWQAGPVGRVVKGSVAACLQGPCYQFQTGMGDQC